VLARSPAGIAMNLKHKQWLLLSVVLVAVVVAICLGPIPQDPAYHRFADTRRLLGIDNFWNVVSNVPFVLVGLYGMGRARRLAEPESTAGYLLLCTGVFLVGFGSAYYHLAPSNAALVWDRLPMTVAFMALLALLLAERVGGSHRLVTLGLLVGCGAATVFYWAWTEAQGRGDLRPYGLVQFLPVVLIPLLLVLFPARWIRSGWLCGAFGLYVAAKLLEHFDRQVFAATGMGGHALKHLAAAAAALCIILAVRTREGPAAPAAVRA
jgi:hypothetical protein